MVHGNEVTKATKVKRTNSIEFRYKTIVRVVFTCGYSIQRMRKQRRVSLCTGGGESRMQGVKVAATYIVIFLKRNRVHG